MAAATHDTRPEDCATAWFAVLERALDEGDIKRAAEAESELNRLGVTVRFRRVVTTKREGRRDA